MKTITLTENVIVSDPCYKLDQAFGPVLLDNVLEGQYVVFVKQRGMGDWGNRISHLFAVHVDVNQNGNKLIWENQGQIIGVDSGQAGIFTLDSYMNEKVFAGQLNKFNNDESWYGHICERTVSKEQWGVFENGVVSSSGFGDGEYKLFLAKENENIIGIAIEFIDVGYQFGEFEN